MGYVERTLGPRPRPTLTIEGEAYDIDYVGLDDGHDGEPDPTIRVVLQLGAGLMIYVWVVATTQPGSTAWFDSFWTKDCAAAEVEERDHGPPARARCAPFVLPPLYAAFVLERAGAPPRRFALGGVTFEADIAPGARRVEVRFALERDAEVAWSAGPGPVAGWRLTEGGATRVLGASERVTFSS